MEVECEGEDVVRNTREKRDTGRTLLEDEHSKDLEVAHFSAFKVVFYQLSLCSSSSFSNPRF